MVEWHPLAPDPSSSAKGPQNPLAVLVAWSDSRMGLLQPPGGVARVHLLDPRACLMSWLNLIFVSNQWGSKGEKKSFHRGGVSPPSPKLRCPSPGPCPGRCHRPRELLLALCPAENELILLEFVTLV